MRLINAESPQNRMYVSDLVIEEMKKIPTVDIVLPTRSQFKRMAVQLGYVPIVHCKDCKYYQDNNDGYPHEECRWGHGETPNEDDFCSYGERKENDDA